MRKRKMMVRKVAIAHTTGCSSVDLVLDICYTWIAQEQGILKKRFLKRIEN